MIFDLCQISPHFSYSASFTSSNKQQWSTGSSLPPSLSFTELVWELESETLEISDIAVLAPGPA